MKKIISTILICFVAFVVQSSVVIAADNSFSYHFNMQQSYLQINQGFIKEDAEQKAYFVIQNSSGIGGVNIYLDSVRLDHTQLRSEWVTFRANSGFQRLNADYQKYAASGYYYGLTGRVSIGSVNVTGRFTP